MARHRPARDDSATDATHAWGMRAGIAAFATLAVLVPHVVIAEIDRNAARSERLARGSDVPRLPVLPNLRDMHRDPLRDSRPSVSIAPVSVLARVPAVGVAVAARAPDAPGEFSEAPSSFPVPPENGWPRLLDGKSHSGRPQPFALSAIDTSFVPAGRAGNLPWSPAPAIPSLVTKPERDAAVPPARLELPPLPPRLLTPKGGALGVPTLAQRYRISPRLARAMTRPGDPEWLSGAARMPESRGTDPIGDPAAAIATAQPPKPAGPAFILPFENGRVTSLFNQGRRHPAIDLAGRHGSPVFATSSDQKVTFAGWRGGYGNAVITRDPQGREHLYGHLSAIWTRVGTTLAQGDRLGALGSTGYSTGPHVHYEVKDRRGAHINPVTLLFPRGVSNGYAWAGTGLVRSGTATASATPEKTGVPAQPAAEPPAARMRVASVQPAPAQATAPQAAPARPAKPRAPRPRRTYVDDDND